MPDVTFSFDPACPWTWRTSRWLLDVAPKRDITIEWRAFSLLIANGDAVPEDRRSRLETSNRALRLVEALRRLDEPHAIEHFYTELGKRLHEDGRDLDGDVLTEAIDAAGLQSMREALDDQSLDAAVRASHESAFAAAGPDVGSPILQVRGRARGLHGPIIDEGMSTEDRVALWDAVDSLLAIPQFYELKHGRG
jgi:predicted DsbA family dithiol-disulfide isomerase